MALAQGYAMARHQLALVLRFILLLISMFLTYNRYVF